MIRAARRLNRGRAVSVAVSEIQVRHVMTKEVLTVLESATLAEAALIMRKNHVSGLPVLDDRKRPIGILSEKDILRALEEPMSTSLPATLIDLVLDRGIKAQTRLEMLRDQLGTNRVGQWMTPDPITIPADAPASRAAQIMAERRINRLPVVEAGRLVGIVTRHDVLSAM